MELTVENPLNGFYKIRGSFLSINPSNTDIVSDFFSQADTSQMDFPVNVIKKWYGDNTERLLRNEANPLCGSAGNEPLTDDDTQSGYDIECDPVQHLIIEKNTLEYRNPDKVESFLKDYPSIRSYIKSILPSVPKYFGEKSKVILELMEFKTEKPFNELVAWIQFSGDLDDGLDRLDKFENDFLLNRIEEFCGLFNFNIEFK